MNASLCYLTFGKGEDYVHREQWDYFAVKVSVLYGGTWEGEAAAPRRSAPLLSSPLCPAGSQDSQHHHLQHARKERCSAGWTIELHGANQKMT